MLLTAAAALIPPIGIKITSPATTTIKANITATRFTLISFLPARLADKTVTILNEKKPGRYKISAMYIKLNPLPNIHGNTQLPARMQITATAIKLKVIVLHICCTLSIESIILFPAL